MPKFGFGTDKVNKETQKGLDDVRASHDAAVESAKLLLHSKGFEKFINEYREVERKTINILIKYAGEEADPLRFGMVAKDLLGKIQHIKVLLDTGHGKAGEKYVA